MGCSSLAGLAAAGILILANSARSPSLTDHVLISSIFPVFSESAFGILGDLEIRDDRSISMPARGVQVWAKELHREEYEAWESEVLTGAAS